MNMTSVLLVGLRGFLGFIFLRSGRSKLRDTFTFQHDVVAYRLLPVHFARFFGKILPYFEITIGALLFIGIASATAAALGGLLLMLFTFAITINLAKGRKNDCGCHGVDKREPISLKLVLRNVLLVMLTIPIILTGGGHLAIDYFIFSAQKDFAFQILLPLLLIIIGCYTVLLLGKQLEALLHADSYSHL